MLAAVLSRAGAAARPSLASCRPFSLGSHFTVSAAYLSKPTLRTFSTLKSSNSFKFNPIQWWRENNARLKKLVLSYGWFAGATYLGVYVTTLTGLFVMVRLGAIGPSIDVGAAIDSWSIKKALFGEERLHINPVLSDFLVAWLLTKTTEPARLAVTIATIPVLVRHMPPAVLRFLRVPQDMWHPHFRDLPRALRLPLSGPSYHSMKDPRGNLSVAAKLQQPNHALAEPEIFSSLQNLPVKFRGRVSRAAAAGVEQRNHLLRYIVARWHR